MLTCLIILKIIINTFIYLDLNFHLIINQQYKKPRKNAFRYEKMLSEAFGLFPARVNKIDIHKEDQC
jgi:hypothetical protein